MKVRMVFVCVMIFATILIPVFGDNHGDDCDVVFLFDGWARATTPGMPNGAVYGLLVNLTEEVDTLMGASTDAAEVVELHEVIMGDDDVMQMRPVEGGFVVEANNYLELRPGGLHIMLINLKAPLEAGDMLDLVLEFEHAGEVSLFIPVKDMAEMEGHMGMTSGMDEANTGMASDEMASGSTETMQWDESCQKIHFVGGWARPAMAGMPNSAAYGLLLNLTQINDILVGGTTDVAEAVELHEMIMGDDDVMQMRPVEGGILLPIGHAVVLKPGGLHIMLIGLGQPLEAETTLNIQLEFAEYDNMDITVPVYEPEEMQMMGEMSG